MPKNSFSPQWGSSNFWWLRSPNWVNGRSRTSSWEWSRMLAGQRSAPRPSRHCGGVFRIPLMDRPSAEAPQGATGFGGLQRFRRLSFGKDSQEVKSSRDGNPSRLLFWDSNLFTQGRAPFLIERTATPCDFSVTTCSSAHASRRLSGDVKRCSLFSEPPSLSPKFPAPHGPIPEFNGLESVGSNL